MGDGDAPLRSVEHPGARVSVLYRYGDVEVMVMEIHPQGKLYEPSVWGEASWHLVVEGRARFEQGEHGWEVLSSHSLRLSGAEPYRVCNPGEDRLRVLSIVARAGATADVDVLP